MRGETVCSELVRTIVAGRVAVVCVTKLVGEGAQGCGVSHSDAEGDGAAVGLPCGFGAAAVPADFVSAVLGDLDEGVKIASQSGLHLFRIGWRLHPGMSRPRGG